MRSEGPVTAQNLVKLSQERNRRISLTDLANPRPGDMTGYPPTCSYSGRCLCRAQNWTWGIVDKHETRCTDVGDGFV